MSHKHALEVVPASVLAFLGASVGIACKSPPPLVPPVTRASLLVLPPSYWRRYLRTLLFCTNANHTLDLILITCLLATLVMPSSPAVAQGISFGLTSLSCCELALKILATGFTSVATFSVRTFMDTIITFLAILFWSLGLSPSIIHLRALRVLSVLERIPFLRDVRIASMAVSRSIYTVVHVISFLCFACVFFALAGYQIFHMRVPAYVDAGTSILTVLVTHASGWNEASFESVRIYGAWHFLYQFVAITILSFVVLQLFIAVIAENFSKLRSQMKPNETLPDEEGGGGSRISPSQPRRRRSLLIEAQSMSPIFDIQNLISPTLAATSDPAVVEPLSLLGTKRHSFRDSLIGAPPWMFHLRQKMITIRTSTVYGPLTLTLVLACTVVNAIMAQEPDPSPTLTHHPQLLTTDTILTFLLACDAIFRVVSFGGSYRGYFRSHWRKMESGVVVLSLVGWIAMHAANSYHSLHALHAVSAVRLFGDIPQIQTLLSAVFRSMGSLLSVLLLLESVTLLFALISMQLFPTSSRDIFSAHLMFLQVFTGDQFDELLMGITADQEPLLQGVSLAVVFLYYFVARCVIYNMLVCVALEFFEMDDETKRLQQSLRLRGSATTTLRRHSSVYRDEEDDMPAIFADVLDPTVIPHGAYDDALNEVFYDERSDERDQDDIQESILGASFGRQSVNMQSFGSPLTKSGTTSWAFEPSSPLQSEGSPRQRMPPSRGNLQPLQTFVAFSEEATKVSPSEAVPLASPPHSPLVRLYSFSEADLRRPSGLEDEGVGPLSILKRGSGLEGAKRSPGTVSLGGITPKRSPTTIITEEEDALPGRMSPPSFPTVEPNSGQSLDTSLHYLTERPSSPAVEANSEQPSQETVSGDDSPLLSLGARRRSQRPVPLVGLVLDPVQVSQVTEDAGTVPDDTDSLPSIDRDWVSRVEQMAIEGCHSSAFSPKHGSPLRPTLRSLDGGQERDDEVVETSYHEYFHNVVFVPALLAGSLMMLFQTPVGADRERYQDWAPAILLTCIDTALVCIYTADIVLTMQLRRSHILSFEGIVDVLGTLAHFLELVYYVPHLVVLRILRPMRVLVRHRQFHRIVEGLRNGIHEVVTTLGLLLVMIVVFAILGTDLYAGTLTTCNVMMQPCSGIAFSSKNNVLMPVVWTRPASHFDTFSDSLLSVFFVTTMVNYFDIMKRATDNSPYNALFFVAVIVFCALFATSLFIGAVIEVLKKYEGSSFFTPKQQRWVFFRQYLLLLRPLREMSRPTQTRRLLQHVSTWYSNGAVGAALGSQVTIVIFATHYPAMNPYVAPACLAMSWVYVADVVVTGIIYPWRSLIHDLWYIYDALVASAHFIFLLSICITGCDFAFHAALMCFLMLRLIRCVHQLRVIVNTFLTSLGEVAQVLFVFIALTFMFACVGMTWFGHAKYGFLYGPTLNFRSFPRALMTLFVVATGDEWAQLMHDIARQDAVTASGIAFFFITYYVLSAYVIFNVIIAVVIRSFAHIYTTHSFVISHQNLEKFQAVWKRMDPNANGYIEAHKFSTLVRRLYQYDCTIVTSIHFSAILLEAAAWKVQLLQPKEQSRYFFENVLIAVCNFAISNDSLTHEENVEKTALQWKAKLARRGNDIDDMLGAYSAQSLALVASIKVERGLNRQAALVELRRLSIGRSYLKVMVRISKRLYDQRQDSFPRSPTAGPLSPKSEDISNMRRSLQLNGLSLQQQVELLDEAHTMKTFSDIENVKSTMQHAVGNTFLGDAGVDWILDNVLMSRPCATRRTARQLLTRMMNVRFIHGPTLTTSYADDAQSLYVFYESSNVHPGVDVGDMLERMRDAVTGVPLRIRKSQLFGPKTMFFYGTDAIAWLEKNETPSAASLLQYLILNSIIRPVGKVRKGTEVGVDPHQEYQFVHTRIAEENPAVEMAIVHNEDHLMKFFWTSQIPTVSGGMTLRPMKIKHEEVPNCFSENAGIICVLLTQTLVSMNAARDDAVTFLRSMQTLGWITSCYSHCVFSDTHQLFYFSTAPLLKCVEKNGLCYVDEDLNVAVLMSELRMRFRQGIKQQILFLFLRERVFAEPVPNYHIDMTMGYLCEKTRLIRRDADMFYFDENNDAIINPAPNLLWGPDILHMFEGYFESDTDWVRGDISRSTTDVPWHLRTAIHTKFSWKTTGKDARSKAIHDYAERYYSEKEVV